MKKYRKNQLIDTVHIRNTMIYSTPSLCRIFGKKSVGCNVLTYSLTEITKMTFKVNV